MVNVSWWQQTMDVPCAYRNIDPVAAQGSKKRRSSVDGMVYVSCACMGRDPADLPEPIEMARFLDDAAEADMVS